MRRPGRFEQLLQDWVDAPVPIAVCLARPPRVVLVDRPEGVPDCAELHEDEEGVLTWRWVEQTFRILDDGEPELLAERLDVLYGATWRCTGMGT